MADDRDKLVDLCARLAGRKNWQEFGAQKELKLLLVCIWRHLDHYSRSKFVASLDNGFQFRPVPDPKPDDDAELSMILRRWDEVVPHLHGAEREFAEDVLKRRYWKNWRPSEKQRAWIGRIWAAFIDADVEVVE